MNDRYSTRDLKKMLMNPWYKSYWDKKQEIINRYPPQKERTREQHLEFMKEVGDLMWEHNGDFQHYIWDMIPEVDRIEMERRANGKKKKRDTI